MKVYLSNFTVENSYKLMMLAFVLIFFACSCAPRYRTTYDFTPPTSEQGKTCVFQCENTKLQCEQLQEMKLQNCRDREDLKQQKCQDKAEKEYERCKAKGNQICFQAACPISECYKGTKCETQYRRCYQTCGGKVTSTRSCVANCEKE